MGDWKDLFPSRTVLTTSPTAPVETSLEAVDLRIEFDRLIYGNDGESPIGQPFILRRMRRDDDGEMTSCTCVNALTLEPDRDFICPYCLGRGYLWDEELVYGYKVIAASPGGSNAEVNLQKTPTGKMYVPAGRVYLPYDIEPTIDDRLVEIELDEEGTAVTPYNRLAVYEFPLVRAMRGDSGGIEFWVVNCQTMGPETRGLIG